MSKKNIVVTAGDPAGCGPFITLKAIEDYPKTNVDFIVVGDKKVFEKIPIYKRTKKRINLIDLDTPGIEKIKEGYFSKIGGQASLNYLTKSLEIMEKEKIKRLVTAPLSKEAVKCIYPKFSGHTEYLADYFKVNNFAMLMTSRKLKVVLLTRHIPLRKVGFFIKKRNILNSIFLIHSFFRHQFKIKNPRIVFTSLNPHAGINTFLDKEEKMIIAAIKEFKRPLYGPYPADTIFTKESLKQYNCVICMYHDQAMIPFKLLSMRRGVNVTLGLPILRTSPAHGTAYEVIKEKKTPFHSAMLDAIKLALKLSI